MDSSLTWLVVPSASICGLVLLAACTIDWLTARYGDHDASDESQT